MTPKEVEEAKGALAWQWVRAVRAATNELRSGLRALDGRQAHQRVEELDWYGVPGDEDVLFEITKWLTDQVARATLDSDEPLTPIGVLQAQSANDGKAPLGLRLGQRFAFTEHQRAVLLAVRNRIRSPIYNEEATAAPTASWYVEHAAEAIKRFVPGSASHTPEDRAAFLVRSLTLHVHSGFSSLKGRSAEVLGLLRRYQPDRSRRRTKAGEPSKLSEDGILELLNDLAGRPLGAINANSIAAAKRREKQAKEP